MEKQRIIHRDATLWPPTPTRAPNSVFDTAPKPRGERTPMPALTVRYDVPLPAVVTSAMLNIEVDEGDA